jgi:hypothetical protein
MRPERRVAAKRKVPLARFEVLDYEPFDFRR